MNTYHTHTHTLTVDAHTPQHHAIDQASRMIRAGGLVAFPTETVYGLGANALDAHAVRKIFMAKQRPATDPIIVHIHDIAQLDDIAQHIPPVVPQLASTFWAGALTLILKRHPNVPDVITAGQDTVAVRMPDHPVALALLRQAQTPIGAPSANRFSRPSPTTAAHVLADLEGHVDIILDGGATPIGVESTILDLTHATPRILRPGGITLEALRAVLPDVTFTARYLAENSPAPASGMLIKHYSPDARVLLYRGDYGAVMRQMLAVAHTYARQGQPVGILLRHEERADLGGLVAHYADLGATPQEHAQRLFACLRQLDAQGVPAILVRAPEEEGIGLALWDRLLRSAEGQVIDVTTPD